MNDIEHNKELLDEIFWKKAPEKHSDKEIKEFFSKVWTSGRTSEDQTTAIMLLVTEIQARSSKKYFRGTVIISITALIISLISVFFS